MNAEALTVEDISKLIECYEERIECAFDAFTKVQDASMVLTDYLTEHTPLTGNWRPGYARNEGGLDCFCIDAKGS